MPKSEIAQVCIRPELKQEIEELKRPSKLYRGNGGLKTSLRHGLMNSVTSTSTRACATAPEESRRFPQG
jgi:hypothetical protein